MDKHLDRIKCLLLHLGRSSSPSSSSCSSSFYVWWCCSCFWDFFAVGDSEVIRIDQYWYYPQKYWFFFDLEVLLCKLCLSLQATSSSEIPQPDPGEWASHKAHPLYICMLYEKLMKICWRWCKMHIFSVYENSDSCTVAYARVRKNKRNTGTSLTSSYFYYVFFYISHIFDIGHGSSVCSVDEPWSIPVQQPSTGYSGFSPCYRSSAGSHTWSKRCHLCRCQSQGDHHRSVTNVSSVVMVIWKHFLHAYERFLSSSVNRSLSAFNTFNSSWGRVSCFFHETSSEWQVRQTGMLVWERAIDVRPTSSCTLILTLTAEVEVKASVKRREPIKDLCHLVLKDFLRDSQREKTNKCWRSNTCL